MVSDTMPSTLGPLVIVPQIYCQVVDAERVTLTQKFVDGMARYCALWPGPVKVIVTANGVQSNNLDNVTVRLDALPFEVEVSSLERQDLESKFAGAGLVLAGPDYRIPDLIAVCRAAEVPCVNLTELTLTTRMQIARLHTPSRYRLLRKALWELNQERLNYQVIARSAGIQCNGIPTYKAYKRVSRNALLFFDTRTERAMYATEEDMTRRKERLFSGKPLTLLFSGRLIPMKGAEDLIDVASHLKRMGFAFRFLIAGDGSSLEAMRARIAREQLHEVELLGVLPFGSGLMPLARREADLFVCCHRQGDPSCTYLETLSAGVPIVGFTNEAFRGLLEYAQIGAGAPVGASDELARRIASLTREQLWDFAQNGLQFASGHDFESTFERRVAHMVNAAEEYRLGRARPSQLPAFG